MSVSSCKNNKPEDAKDVAEEHNDAKFDKNKDDAQFLVNAAEINLEEIQLAELAEHNSNVTEVKNLGKMMEEEHSKCLSDLAGLAKKKSITIPTSATEKAQNTYKDLSKKTGLDFDKKYCDMMVSGHKDAIALFEKASTESVDADIKEWALATLPTLRTHLDHAITCQKVCDKIK